MRNSKRDEVESSLAPLGGPAVQWTGTTEVKWGLEGTNASGAELLLGDKSFRTSLLGVETAIMG